MNRRAWAERVFSAMPVSLQNLACTIHGIRLRRRRYGRVFRDRLAALKESQWCDAGAIRTYQDAQLREMVRHCAESVPYYRDLFREHGISPEDIASREDLRKLPVLTKETVREQSERLISQRFPRRALLSDVTSGTTGTALRVFYTREAQQFQWAIWWRHKSRFGLNPGDPYLALGGRLPALVGQKKPPYWRYNAAMRQTYLSPYHLTPEYLPEIVNFLNRSEFAFYTGFPVALATIAEFMRERGLPLIRKPRCVVTGADGLLPNFERVMREQWNVPVTEQYGAAECCVNLSKCEHGVFHEDYEFGICELLDNPLNPSGPKRIIGTGFANPAMPFLRYDIGDLATESSEPCPCGRVTRTVTRIDGRIQNYIRASCGRVVYGIDKVFKRESGIREAQIVQNEEDRIVVKVVKRRSYAESDGATLVESIHKLTGGQLNIDLEFVESIPRAANGKFRAVVSTLPADVLLAEAGRTHETISNP